LLLALNRLIAHGMPFSYTPARSFISASKVTKGLAVRLPVVTMNGAFIVDPVDGRRNANRLLWR